MYLDPRELSALEARYGAPRDLALEEEFSDEGFRLLRFSMRDGRAHDVTLFIRYAPPGESDAGERFVVIRKPSYPPGAYRAPSGGVRPGEPFEAGALREAWEETGLEVVLERYLLRVHATFTRRGERARWTSHVFAARAVGGDLDPKDTREIAGVRLATVEALRGEIRAALMASDLGGLRYRALLTDATLDCLSDAHV